MDLPLPLTPVTTDITPNGNFTSIFLRLCSRAPFTSIYDDQCRRCDGTGIDSWPLRYLTVDEAIEFFGEDTQSSIARRIVARLLPLQQVGLGYVKLGQTSSTLSGGENQRVKLAYYLSLEKQKPTVFIFDEPTTGLHFHDISVLLSSFERLIAKGHTIIIIEHNPDVIKCADHVIDIGPEGGDAGGSVVATGTPEEIAACPDSHTGKFLKF